MRFFKHNLTLRDLSSAFKTVILTVVALTGLSSCSAIYDDLDECERGVKMRFIFDHNLEFANSFYSQVHCLTVYVFDENEDLVERRTETSRLLLSDEDWRMTFDLPAGKYKALAYGGMECDETSFNQTKQIDEIKTYRDLEVLVNMEHIGTVDQNPTAPLHDHFYGAADFTVSEANAYDKVILPMKRNTNHLRILLQNVSNYPVDHSDFRFEVIDDNTLFDHENNIVPNGLITYSPWVKDNLFVGTDGDNEVSSTRSEQKPVQIAFAEMSLSRLIHKSSYVWTRANGEVARGPRLRITNVNDNHVVADLPLNNYLLAMKNEYLSGMDSQEYLDRAYRHNLIFFLDSENRYWIHMNIVVGEWTVRLENIDF